MLDTLEGLLTQLRLPVGEPILAALALAAAVLLLAVSAAISFFVAFRQLCVAKSRNIPDIPALSRLDLTKNHSLSLAPDSRHSLLR